MEQQSNRATPDDLIPIAEAAILVERSVKTLYHWIRQRRIAAWKRLNRIYLSRHDIECLATYEPMEPE